MRPRSSSLVASVFAIAFAAPALVARPALADVPVGWAAQSTVDGGTSSLGSSIATTSTVAIVGAPFAALSSGASPTGAAYVFIPGQPSASAAPIAPSDPIDGGNFGTAVAASGSLLAVGAPGDPPAAYVFATSSDGGYTQAHAWADPASDGNKSFGSSVAAFEGADGAAWVAVAAPPGSANQAGAVYVSRRLDGGAWSDPPTALTDPSAQAFGLAVAFAGNGQLLVGDPGTGAGQVLLYSPLPDGGWAPTGTLPVSYGAGLQSFGNGIAASADLAVVTAPGSIDDAGALNGVAFVFVSQDGGAWTQQAVLTGAPTESFGNFVPSVGDGVIAIGSAINTASSGAGQVDVWGWNGAQWVAIPSSALRGDAYYGQAVGFVGGTLYVGDTSAMGAATVSDVTSSLSLVAAVYADAGAGGATDAGRLQPDAATGSNGGTGGGSGSSGCSVASTEREGESPWLLAEAIAVAVAWGARRRLGVRRG